MVELPLKFCNWDEYRAWDDGSLWLSLDRFERFWPDAGLAFSNGEAVKSAIREALRGTYARDAANRARFAADPDHLGHAVDAFVHFSSLLITSIRPNRQLIQLG